MIWALYVVALLYSPFMKRAGKKGDHNNEEEHNDSPDYMPYYPR
jgi:hypothetical protein